MFGLKFLKKTQLHYDMNPDPKMLTKKLQMIAST